MKNFGLSTKEINKYVDSIQGGLTPYILEEREMRVTQMDVFSITYQRKFNLNSK